MKYSGLLSLCLSIPLLGSCAPVIVTGATTAGVSIAQERSVGNAVDDTGIYLTIKNLFAREETNELLANIHVEVIEGRVLLTGKARHPESAIKAVQLAWRAEGVKEVINEIKVADKSGLKDVATDTWITTQIKSKMLITKNVRSINYSVETINGEVYLFGIAQNEEELNTVINIARTTKYVRQVISHVRLKADPRRKGVY